jgi:NitT/TauT family transport system permease protein
MARARRGVRGDTWVKTDADRVRVWVWRIVIFVALIAGWEWLTGIKAVSRTPGLYWLDPFFISRPSAIARRFMYLASGEVRLSIWQMALSTVQSTIWGFLVGVSTGFVAGLVLGRNDRLARILEPYIIAFNSLPRIALVPLITMIFGFGVVAKIVLAWTIVFFIVFFNTFQGTRSVDADLVHAARFLGGGDRQIMRTVIVPSALAWTFASLTPSISFALIGVVVGEFLGGESGGGLGYLIIQSLGTLNAADMMVALVTLGVIGIVMALGIKQVERRLLRWRPEYRSRA